MRDTSGNKYRNWVFTWNFDSDQIPAEQLDRYLKSNTEKYVFQEEEGEETHRRHYQGSFRTTIRKRHSTLLKEFYDEFGNIDNLTINRMCGTWQESYSYCTKEETRKGPIYQSRFLKEQYQEEYKGNDLEILNDRDSWFPWQSTIADKIFVQDTFTCSIADDREILWIEDTEGCTGKSKFTKFICSTNDDIIKLPFGTSSQLRSAVINAGPRKVYAIDIPRTVGEDDDLTALLSVIEDIKNGFVVSSMYGKYQDLMMEPPHVLVFSNEPAPIGLMTKDRWTVFKIDKGSLELLSKPIERQHPGNGFDETELLPADVEDFDYLMEEDDDTIDS